MKLAICGAAMALCCLTAMPASAGIIPISAKWTIDTSKVPDRVELRKGKVLFSADLRPSKLVAIDAAAIATGTAELRAASGGQFILYTTGTGDEVYCSTKTVDLMRKGSLLYFRYGDTFMCLLDRDHDGKFELSYEIRSGLAAVPILTHGKTDDMVAITPVSYTLIDPAQLNIQLTLTLRWNIGNGLDDRLGFNVNVEGKTGSLALASWYGLDKGEVPGTFGFANLRIHAASAIAKAATIDIEKLSPRGTMLTSADRVAFGIN